MGWPCPHGVLLLLLLLLILATTFFSFTRLFWNQMVIWRSVRLVVAEIFLLLSRVMNLLLAYSFSSSFSCPLLYGTLFLRPRRKEQPSGGSCPAESGNGKRRGLRGVVGEGGGSRHLSLREAAPLLPATPFLPSSLLTAMVLKFIEMLCSPNCYLNIDFLP